MVAASNAAKTSTKTSMVLSMVSLALSFEVPSSSRLALSVKSHGGFTGFL
jgi:hypothetical protein